MASDPAGKAPRALGPGLALAIVGAIAFSGKAIIVKLAYRHGVDAVTLIMYRMLLALPFFLVMAWWGGRGKPALGRREWLGVIGLGMRGYYISSFLDFYGLQYISASLERLILYLNPTLVLLLGWVLHQRRFHPQQLLGMVVSYCGVLLVFGHEVGLQGRDVVLGTALVLVSALTYAVYLVYSAEMVSRYGSLRLVGLASTVACACCILQFLLLRPLSAALVPQPVLLLSVINALVCTVAPVLMVMMAIERIGAPLAAQAGMVGPMSTILLSVWLLGESFTPWLAAGTAAVVAGIWVFSRAGRAPAVVPGRS